MSVLNFFDSNAIVEKVDVPPTYATVCFLIINRAPDYSVIVPRRSTQLKSHRGQVSFAGGKNDPGDKDYIHTGLRELEEELGFVLGREQVHGRLEQTTSINGLPVIPIVATIEEDQLNQLRINHDEVASVFEVPLEELQIHNAIPFDTVMFGTRRSTYHFDTSQVSIWGLTARIIYDARITIPSDDA